MTGLVLASQSAVRAQVLKNAGLNFSTVSSGVDEDRIKAAMLAGGASPAEIASALADAKALAVSQGAETIVIGADQTLELEGRLFDKAESLDEARERLKTLRGKAHVLHSALTAARGGKVIWRMLESPRLTVRDFSDAWLDGYLERQGGSLLSSVGCYRLEDEGVQLFETIEGDYFAILGLPLVGLLAFLRQEGLVGT